MHFIQNCSAKMHVCNMYSAFSSPPLISSYRWLTVIKVCVMRHVLLCGSCKQALVWIIRIKYLILAPSVFDLSMYHLLCFIPCFKHVACKCWGKTKRARPCSIFYTGDIIFQILQFNSTRSEGMIRLVLSYAMSFDLGEIPRKLPHIKTLH